MTMTGLTKIITKTAAIGVALGIGLYSSQATAGQVIGTQYKYNPTEQQMRVPTGTDVVTVGAGIKTSKELYNAALPNDPLEFAVDVFAKSNGKDVPVWGYTVQMCITPAYTVDTVGGTRNDFCYKPIETRFNTPTMLKGILAPESELELVHQDYRVLQELAKDGDYVIYTRGTVTVADKRGKLDRRIVGPEAGKNNLSYDNFKVVGTEGMNLPYDTTEVKRWLNEGIKFTMGGIFHPKWDNLIVADALDDNNPLGVLYKAKKHRGRNYSILPTSGYDYDGRWIPTQACLTAEEPCLANLGEQTRFLGADLEDKGWSRKVKVYANGLTENAEVVTPGTRFTARLGGMSKKGSAGNHGTYSVVGTGELREYITQEGVETRIGVADRLFEARSDYVATVEVPSMGGIFGVEQTLWARFGYDRNGDGIVGPDEEELKPVGQKVAYDWHTPGGNEAAAAAGGFALGYIAGFLTRELIDDDRPLEINFPEWPDIPCDDCDDNAIFTPGTQTSPVQ